MWTPSTWALESSPSRFGATTKILEIDDAIVNVLGSGCSLGHPIAMTGARMVISLIHELWRRGGGTGVAAMCTGGGMSRTGTGGGGAVRPDGRVTSGRSPREITSMISPALGDDTPSHVRAAPCDGLAASVLRKPIVREWN
jgi:Thiolase, C-terminal domain